MLKFNVTSGSQSEENRMDARTQTSRAASGMYILLYTYNCTPLPWQWTLSVGVMNPVQGKYNINTEQEVVASIIKHNTLH